MGEARSNHYHRSAAGQDHPDVSKASRRSCRWDQAGQTREEDLRHSKYGKASRTNRETRSKGTVDVNGRVEVRATRLTVSTKHQHPIRLGLREPRRPQDLSKVLPALDLRGLAAEGGRDTPSLRH